jgi:hypothetical protein
MHLSAKSPNLAFRPDMDCRIVSVWPSIKKFKIRRIIEYPDTEEEGEGGKE